jgi:membrane associated rhomboid family serine protease
LVVLFYLAAGVLANVGTYMGGTSPLSLGGSAGTFGLLGSLAAYYYSNRVALGKYSSAGLSTRSADSLPKSTLTGLKPVPYLPVELVKSKVLLAHFCIIIF